jgi:Ca-activated chloride channel family protein
VKRRSWAGPALRVVLVLFWIGGVGVLALLYPWWFRGDGWGHTKYMYDWAKWFLAVVPFVLAAGLFLEDRRTPRLRIGAIGPVLSGPRGFRSYLRDLPAVVRAWAVAMLIAAMMRPINVLRDETSEESGIDIMVVLDLSGSMQAVLDANARDIPGAPDLPRGKRLTRLDVAKLVIKDFIGRREDRIGAIVFAKEAYLLAPPTRDHQLLQQLVGKLNLRVIDANATAIGEGLGAAVARLRKNEAKSKVIVLLTDGDNNAGKISPEQAIRLAKRERCKVYTIQIGNEDEVDVEIDGTFHRRKFPVNPELLRRIAGETGGQFFMATDAKALVGSMHAVLDQLEKTKFESSRQSFEDLFPFLLFPGVGLVALDALLRALILRRFP